MTGQIKPYTVKAVWTPEEISSAEELKDPSDKDKDRVFTDNDYTYYYNGKVQHPFVYINDEKVKGKNIQIKVNGGQTYAGGEKDYVASAEIIAGKGYDPANYRFDLSDRTFKIKTRKIVVAPNDVKRVYNGANQILEKADFKLMTEDKSGNLIPYEMTEDESISATMNKTMIDAGYYETMASSITVSKIDKDTNKSKDITDNYEITAAIGSVTISPCPVVVEGIEVKEKDERKYYDGTKKAHVKAEKGIVSGTTIYPVDENGKALNEKKLYAKDALNISADKVNAAFTDAGAGDNKTVTLTVSEDALVAGNENTKVGNYKLLPALSQKETKGSISKTKGISVKVNDMSYVYGEKPSYNDYIMSFTVPTYSGQAQDQVLVTSGATFVIKAKNEKTNEYTTVCEDGTSEAMRKLPAGDYYIFLKTVSDGSVFGLNANNHYINNAEQPAKLTVTKRPVRVEKSGEVIKKYYDGTTTAYPEAKHYVFTGVKDDKESGLITGDDLFINYKNANYNSKDIKDASEVAISGVTLAGEKADCYELMNDKFTAPGQNVKFTAPGQIIKKRPLKLYPADTTIKYGQSVSVATTTPAEANIPFAQVVDEKGEDKGFGGTDSFTDIAFVLVSHIFGENQEKYVPGSDVGTYTMDIEGSKYKQDNYEISVGTGCLTVVQATFPAPEVTWDTANTNEKRKVSWSPVEKIGKVEVDHYELYLMVGDREVFSDKNVKTTSYDLSKAVTKDVKDHGPLNYRVMVRAVASAYNNAEFKNVAEMGELGESKEAPSFVAPAPVSGLTYNKGSQQLITSGGNVSVGAVMEYSVEGKSFEGKTRDNFTTSLPAATSAGSYKIHYRIRFNDEVVFDGLELSNSIAKAVPEVTAPVAKTELVYSVDDKNNGKPLLSTLATTEPGCSISYRIDYATLEINETDNTLTEGSKKQYSTYKENKTLGVDAGKYYVYYKVTGNENYLSVSEMGPVTVTIGKADHKTVTKDCFYAVVDSRNIAYGLLDLSQYGDAIEGSNVHLKGGKAKNYENLGKNDIQVGWDIAHYSDDDFLKSRYHIEKDELGRYRIKNDRYLPYKVSGPNVLKNSAGKVTITVYSTNYNDYDIVMGMQRIFLSKSEGSTDNDVTEKTDIAVDSVVANNLADFTNHYTKLHAVTTDANTRVEATMGMKVVSEDTISDPEKYNETLDEYKNQLSDKTAEVKTDTIEINIGVRLQTNITSGDFTDVKSISISDTGVLLDVEVPVEGLSNKENINIIREHTYGNGNTDYTLFRQLDGELTAAELLALDSENDGTFYVKNNVLHLYSNKFSTFKIVYTEKKAAVTPSPKAEDPVKPGSSGGGGGGGGGKTTPQTEADDEDYVFGSIDDLEDAFAEIDDDSEIEGSTFWKLTARVTKRGKKSMKLQWKKVPVADGYIVYGNMCNHHGKKYKIKKMKTFANVNTLCWNRKNLKKGTYYKYYVVAYKNVGKEKKILAISKVVHAATYGHKYTIAKKVKVNKQSVTLATGDTFKIKASEIKDEKKKKIAKHRRINFESQNTDICKVSKKGKIKAVGKGTTYVYAYAQNGLYKKIKVTVK